MSMQPKLRYMVLSKVSIFANIDRILVASFCSFSVSGFLKITTERSDGVAFVSYRMRMLIVLHYHI